MTYSREFLDKYDGLVTENICKLHEVDYNDRIARALLAHRLTTGNEYAFEIQLGKPVQFGITTEGDFVNPNGPEVYGDMHDLVVDPVSLAFRIAADVPLVCINDKKDLDVTDTFTITTQNLKWLAQLFCSMHMVVKNCFKGNVPELWKLCDYSYTDCCHITHPTRLDNTNLFFGFYKGVIVGQKYNDNFEYYMRDADAILYTTKLLNVGYFVQAEKALTAYIEENELPYSLVR